MKFGGRRTPDSIVSELLNKSNANKSENVEHVRRKNSRMVNPVYQPINSRGRTMLRSNLYRLNLFIGLIAIGATTGPPVDAQEGAGKSSVVGVWNVTATSDQGDQASVWTFQKKGDAITGEYLSSQSDEKREISNISFDGKELKFEIAVEYQGEALLLKANSIVDGNKLKGEWSAVRGDQELTSGSLVAEKKKVPAKFSGTWNTTATLPNGETMESSLHLKGKNSDLSGSLNPNDNETKLDRITVEGKAIRMEFAPEIQGESRNVVIEASLDSPKSLSGGWMLVDDSGEETASGDWKAERANQAKSETENAFDGTTLDSFRGYTEEAIGSGWKIEDGALYLDGTKSGDIITKQEFGNFELEFEWKISEGGNSGVMYRVTLGDRKPYLTGPEYQILDDDKHKDGKLASHRSGSLYALYEPQNKTLKPVGQWNTSKIVLNGNSVEHWLNGNKVVEAELGSDDWNAKVADSKFKTWEKFGKNKKGHISFQDHGNPVWYRNIRIKELD